MTRCVVACVQAKEAARAANKEKFATLLTDLHTAGVITHESRWVGTMEKPEMADDERFKVCAATALGHGLGPASPRCPIRADL